MTEAPIRRNIAVATQRLLLVTGGDRTPPSAPPAKGALGSAELPRNPTHAQDHERGHAAGLKQGLVDASARIDQEVQARVQQLQAEHDQAERRRADEHAQRINALDAMMQTLQRALPERFLGLERQAVMLAYEALCKIAGAQDERAGVLADAVRQGMDQLRGSALLVARLHPLDLKALAQHQAWRTLVERYPEVRWTGDGAVERSGCELETDHGRLDVSLGVQLSSLRDLWARADAGGASADVLGGRE